jgi:hypothetical protein
LSVRACAVRHSPRCMGFRAHVVFFRGICSPLHCVGATRGHRAGQFYETSLYSAICDYVEISNDVKSLVMNFQFWY